MAIYMGGNKQKVTLNNTSYFCNVYIKNSKPTISDRLLSSDGYVLKDINGLSLMIEKGGN